MNNTRKRPLGSLLTFVLFLGIATVGGFTAGVVTGLILVTEHGSIIQQKLGKFIDFNNEANEDGTTPIAIPEQTG